MLEKTKINKKEAHLKKQVDVHFLIVKNAYPERNGVSAVDVMAMFPCSYRDVAIEPSLRILRYLHIRRKSEHWLAFILMVRSQGYVPG